jgi:hypothetical protein
MAHAQNVKERIAMWIIYNTMAFSVHGRFYLEKDALKKVRRMERRNPGCVGVFAVEHLGDITEKQWKMWKKLQS